MLFKKTLWQWKEPNGRRDYIATGDHKGRTLLYTYIVGCDPCGRPFPD